MITYGINMLLKRTERAVTTTSHIPVPAASDGAMEARTRAQVDHAIEYWTRTHPELDFEVLEINRVVVDTWPATTREEVNRLKGVLERLGNIPGRLNEARISPTDAAAVVDEALDDIRNVVELIERNK